MAIMTSSTMVFQPEELSAPNAIPMTFALIVWSHGMERVESV